MERLNSKFSVMKHLGGSEYGHVALVNDEKEARKLAIDYANERCGTYIVMQWKYSAETKYLKETNYGE